MRPQVPGVQVGGTSPNRSHMHRSHWGSKLLPVVSKPKGKKSAIGQMTLPWAFGEPTNEEISHLAGKFVLANGYPTTVGLPVPDIGIALGWGNLGA